ncbi:MAG: hypothetical protein GQ570_15505 [Helicobacteraceae bacterium]|nr:hypothetical protein [Helicobacteraceae bacterium]
MNFTPEVPIVAFVINRGSLGAELIIPDIPSFGISRDTVEEALLDGREALQKFASSNKFTYDLNDIGYFTDKVKEELNIPKDAKRQIYFIPIITEKSIVEKKTISVSMPIILLGSIDIYLKNHNMKRSNFLSHISEDYLRTHA